MCAQEEIETIWKELREKVKESIKKVRRKNISWKLGRSDIVRNER